jgi:vitamin B12/bleomycin/antimicrobial peptide transport system ATP-binding/permease protein
MRGLGPFLKDAWRLSRPYYVSEEKWSAWGLLASIIALNLALVGMSVLLSFWNREFYNSLQDKNWRDFIGLLFWYRNTESGLMPGFVWIAVVYIVVAVYRTYLNQWLQIRWRRWLTRHFLDEWLADRAYYRISLTTDRAAIGTDNPDQRIAEDLRDFVDSTLSLGIGLLSNVVSLFSFVGILWGLSGDYPLFGIRIPGYMVWVALIYAAIGTVLTHFVGRPLVRLSFRQQRVEADFRYALVRLRENVEGIALYGGEDEEKLNLRDRFAHVIDNWWAIMRRTKLLNSLIAGYDQVAVIFPIIVAAPRYFAGQLPLGGLTQTAGAFGRVQDSLSWFIEAYASLASWRATVERLTSFHRAIVVARSVTGKGLLRPTPAGDSLQVHGLTLSLPNGSNLLDAADITFAPGHSVVVTGRSGSGKSTLFRAIAGIWPFGSGSVQLPAASILFLPQRPYIPLGTLRQVISYPAPPEAYDQAAYAEALGDAGLPDLLAHLDEDENWAQRLSGGEQQRVALARALLAKPAWLFMDEATASLDPESEADLYKILKQRLPATTIVSIAHRPTVAAFHDERLVFHRGAPGVPGRLVETELAATS